MSPPADPRTERVGVTFRVEAQAQPKLQVHKVAVVTGSSGGLGRAIATSFAKAGYSLVLHYHRNAEVAEALADGLRNGIQTTTYKGDLGQSREADGLIAHALQEFGQVDVLVNNSGVNRDALVHKIQDDDWDEVLRTNLSGAMRCTRAALPGMYQRQRGTVINISSAAGQKGFVGSAAYATSKAALIGFTKVVAREAARHNVTCNAIAPGVMNTGMGHALSVKSAEVLKADTALRRLGDPADIGDMAVY
ncbi:MAG: SDR family NAD(P)-dependent oxidoreductase, partial [Halobacteriales archaeon]|nr:SDR family NAD(P)-dependent oxidoreductase [Halobacteriales archaeon]